MAGTTAKTNVAKRVAERAESNQCLICGEKVNGPRGLCSGHYQKFYRALTALPKSERIAFEEEQIREGRILAVLQINEIKRPNPFTRKDAS